MEHKKTRKIDTSPFIHRYDRLSTHFVESFKNDLKAYDPVTGNYKTPKKLVDTYLKITELFDKYYKKETITIDLPNLKLERDRCYEIRNDLDPSLKTRIYNHFDNTFTQQVSITALSGNLFYSWKCSYRMYNPIYDGRTENTKGTPWVFCNISDNANQLGIHIPSQLYNDVIRSRGETRHWYMGIVNGMLDDILLVPSFKNDSQDGPTLYENYKQAVDFWEIDKGGVFLENIFFLRDTLVEYKYIDSSYKKKSKKETKERTTNKKKIKEMKKKVRLNFPHRAYFMDAWYEEQELYKDFHTERPYVLLWDFFGCILLRKLAPIHISNNDYKEEKYRLPVQKYIFYSTLREFARKKKCEINEIISKDSKFYEELISMHNLIYDHRNYS